MVSLLKKHIKTPVIMQMEAAECGAAALAIVLAYYGRYVSLEELRIACGVSRDGSKATNMLLAARQYGLAAHGAKGEPEALTELKFPIIVFWEFNHFVVVEGIDAKKVYINDPASGPRSVTREEFDRAFTGILLTFEPTAAFKKSGAKETLWQKLVPRLQTIKEALAFVIIASLFLVIPGIVIPGFTKIFIDDVLIQNLHSWLLPLLWGMLLTAIFRIALGWLQQAHLLRLEIKIALTASTRFLWHVLRLPISFFNQRFAGDIDSRIASNVRVATLISGDFSTSVVSLISMVFFAIVMFLYDWQLTLLGITVAILNTLLLLFVSNGISNSSRKLQQELGKLSGIEMNGLQAIETIKATSTDHDFFQQWAGWHARTINSQQKIELYARILSVLPGLLSGLLTIAVLGLGGWRIMQGYLTIGSLVAFQSLLASFNEPIATLIGVGTSLQEIKADLARLDDVLHHPEDIRLSASAKATADTSALALAKADSSSSAKLSGKLELKDLSFGYSPLDPPLLDKISLTLLPGQRIAVVGTSGSGKSTLVKVVCGLYQPWSGEILFDDQPLAQIPQSLLCNSVSFVDQDIVLFEGTIRNNLTLWNNAIPISMINKAIEDAEISSVIMMRPHALEGEVLAAGANFSGGQKQQLEISRALINNPTLLVLDEATASLDAKTEQKIMENIKRRNCSLLIVAHRFSTIRDSDEIIVLEQGKIVERGKHEDLYQKQGKYYSLLQEIYDNE